MEKIKWDIDHGCSYGSYLLSGDYNGHRFVRIVLDSFWGLPLMYAKWCITRRYKILYPEQFKNNLEKLKDMNKEQKANSIMGPTGVIISQSKSGYREKHPENLSIFNANICTKNEKIWWGDLDVTLSQTLITDLAFILNEDLYVLYEMDGRFENEGKPRIDKYAVKFFYDGDVELSKSLAENYDNNIRLKK